MPSNQYTSSGNKHSSEKNQGPRFTLTVQQLGKKFNREWIFRNLDYTFHAGERYAITGPNGSGKSTLLQILWGQMPPSLGSISYKNIDDEIPHEEIFKHLTIAAPYLELIDEFTLLEQLRFHFKLKPRRQQMTEEDILDRMQLRHAQHKYISNFSSGMKQRVKLALAFFSQADMIFLDEPGTNLDSHAFDWYLEQLHSLPASTMIFISSNQAQEYPANAQKIDLMGLK